MAFVPLRRVETFMRSERDELLNLVRWPLESAHPEAHSPDFRASVDESSSAASITPIAGILFSHGYGNYVSLIYDWLAGHLAHARIACFGLEHVGHGKSSGLRGMVHDFAHLSSDVRRAARIIRRRFLPAGTPLFGYGESLGGGVVLHASLPGSHPAVFDGLVLISPLIGLHEDQLPHPIVRFVGSLVAACAPTAQLAPVRDILPLCFKDPALAAEIRLDPNRYGARMRLGTAFAFQRGLAELSHRSASVTCPLLVFHGSDDRVTSASASEEFVSRAASRDASMILVEGAWHVLWTESEDVRERMIRRISAWVTDHATESTTAAAARPERVREVWQLNSAHEVVHTDASASTAAHAHGHGHASATEKPARLLPLYRYATHGHLYERSHPRNALEVLDSEEEPATDEDAALIRPAARTM